MSDNGIGIPPEHGAAHLRSVLHDEAAGSGTGLGLAISQRLVAEIGGELSFDSTPNRGSTFRVALPPADADESAQRISEARPTRDGHCSAPAAVRP